jgi:hypothetical protein
MPPKYSFLGCNSIGISTVGTVWGGLNSIYKLNQFNGEFKGEGIA